MSASEVCGRPPFTSPFGGEVDPLGSGEGAFAKLNASKRPPHPSPAGPSPKGRGEAALRTFPSEKF
jgi:hypothetical protein